jgi:hypothetical protein
MTTPRGNQRNKLARFRADLVFATTRSARLSETPSMACDREKIIRQGLGLGPR